jgi:hypothetical protein
VIELETINVITLVSVYSSVVIEFASSLIAVGLAFSVVKMGVNWILHYVK